MANVQVTNPSSLTHRGAFDESAVQDILNTFVQVAPNPQIALILELSASGIVAKAGGGQASATQLTAQTNRVDTVVTAGDSVKLPASQAGLEVTIINNTNNPMGVFGLGTDTINGQAAATGISQPPNSIDFYACAAVGAWSVETGVGYAGSLFTESAQDLLTAHAGGGQALATPITTQTARVGTVATVGDSVLLPPSKPGLELLVMNHGANAMQVFGSGTDTIDDVATATGVSQMANSLVIYTCATAGAWYSEGLATGFGGPGLQTVSSQDNLTAKAGGGQGGGPTINRMMNRVTTVATANDSVTLPASVSGMQIIIVNAAAANAMNIFPAVGDQINALGANNAFASAVNKTNTFYCMTAGQWHVIQG